MARVNSPESGDPDAASRGEAELALRDQRVVEPEKNIAWIMRGLAAQHAEDHGDAHGGGKALARNIPHNGGERSVRRRGDEEEIAANFACGQVDGLDLKARRRTRRALQQQLLHGAGGLKLGCESGAGAGGIDHFCAQQGVGDGGRGLQSNGVQQFQIGRGVGRASCSVGQSDDADWCAALQRRGAQIKRLQVRAPQPRARGSEPQSLTISAIPRSKNRSGERANVDKRPRDLPSEPPDGAAE